MNVLDLFSGIGGFSLGLERAGCRTVAFCEQAEYPRSILKKHWPHIPIYQDVKELNCEQLKEDGIPPIELVCGGFPCQPFSGAGKQRGATDDRDLWPEMFRIIKETRPSWVIGENVAGFINMGLERTISNLESEAYEVQAFVIPACAVGAPHRRDRIWILGYREPGRGHPEAHPVADTGNKRRRYSKRRSAGRDGKRPDGKEFWTHASTETSGSGASRQTVANSQRERLEGYTGNGRGKCEQGWDEKKQNRSISEGSLFTDSGCRQLWAAEPQVGPLAHGLSNRMVRLKAIGNAVVPQIVEIIGHYIMEVENEMAEVR